MPRESNLEVKVGIFVVAAIVCCVGFVFSISDFSMFKKGWTFTTYFHFANGLKKSAPVRLAGVDAGHVQAISVFYDTETHEPKVAVEVWMENGTKIPDDSRFVINQLGILGEKYLEILPGMSRALIVPGASSVGEDPVAMESLTKMISTIGAELQVTLGNINQGILSDENKESLEALLANMADITQSVKDGKGTLGKLLTDTSVYENLDEMTADLKSNPWKLLYRPKK